METDLESLFDQVKKEENFIHKAKLLRFLNVDKDIRIKEIARKIGMKESYVCHILRLNKLTDMIVDGYYSKLISISHLFIISRLHSQEDIMKAYEKVLSENMTVTQTEELVREMLYQTKTIGEHIPKHEIESAESKLKEQTQNTKLKVIQTRIRSKCIIEIKGNLEETTPVLRTILSRLIQDNISS